MFILENNILLIFINYSALKLKKYNKHPVLQLKISTYPIKKRIT